jgi:hypothetical protein
MVYRLQSADPVLRLLCGFSDLVMIHLLFIMHEALFHPNCYKSSQKAQHWDIENPMIICRVPLQQDLMLVYGTLYMLEES